MAGWVIRHSAGYGGHAPVASGQAVCMCGQTVETVGHWVGTDVPHWVTVPG